MKHLQCLACGAEQLLRSNPCGPYCSTCISALCVWQVTAQTPHGALARAICGTEQEWGQSGSGSAHKQVLLTLSQQFAEEKEVLELQCTSLRKDSQMYKKRIEAVLQQMEEVASERDQVITYSSLLITALLLEVGSQCSPICAAV